MDILSQLAEVDDVGLQTLLSHSMRCAIQHNVIAANAEKTEPENDQHKIQLHNGAIMHRETAMLITELVNRVLKQTEPQLPAPPAPRKKK